MLRVVKRPASQSLELFIVKILNIVGLWITLGAVLSAAEYHVAPDGCNDSRGSAESPWATLTHAMKHVSPGDLILVHGGVYRDPVLIDGSMGAVSGTSGNPITITAAPGETPRIFFSASFAQADLWHAHGDQLWATAPGSIPAYDVGTIWHDDQAADKKSAIGELAEDWDFWFDAANECVVVYASTNPATQSKVLEIPLGEEFEHAIQFRDVAHITLSGLTVKYPNSHGIQFSNSNNITIRDCDISHGGGAYIWGNVIRYGNGVELYNGGHHITVEQCRISWFWDTGITNQGNEGDQSHITYRNNTIFNTKCGLEHWVTGPANVSDVLYEGNTVMDSGDNWAQNMQNVWGAVRLMRRHPNGVGAEIPNTGKVERFVVRNNTFVRCGSLAGAQTGVAQPFEEHPTVRLIGGPYIVRDNVLRDGRSVGIFADHGFSGEITGNSIEGNTGQAIVLRDISEDAIIKNNPVRP